MSCDVESSVAELDLRFLITPTMSSSIPPQFELRRATTGLQPQGHRNEGSLMCRRG